MIRYKTDIFPPQFSETVLAELDVRFSRKTADVAASEGPLPLGLVLTRDKDGVYQPLSVSTVEATGEGENAAPATSTPNGEACAVLISPLEASEGKRKAVVLTGYAILNANQMVWDASVTDKTAALAQLEARGFVIREVADANAAE